MAIVLDQTTSRILDNGKTGLQSANDFMTVQTVGVRELANKLLKAAQAFGREGSRDLESAAIAASAPIRKAYKDLCGNVTGNLAKSVDTKKGKNRYDGVGIAVTGPQYASYSHEEEEGVAEQGAGNHAWLVEFGTGPRRPGTQNRRTYINVHRMINGRMTRHTTSSRQAFDNETFQNMSRGYYFLMGSSEEKTRQARRGSGYPHDFGFTEGKGQHPVTLHPGETYGAMPARAPMQKAIARTSSEVLSKLSAAIQKRINKLGSAA